MSYMKATVTEEDDFVLGDIPEYPMDVPSDAPGYNFFRPMKKSDIEELVDDWLKKNDSGGF